MLRLIRPYFEVWMWHSRQNRHVGELLLQEPYARSCHALRVARLRNKTTGTQRRLRCARAVIGGLILRGWGLKDFARAGLGDQGQGRSVRDVGCGALYSVHIFRVCLSSRSSTVKLSFEIDVTLRLLVCKVASSACRKAIRHTTEVR